MPAQPLTADEVELLTSWILYLRSRTLPAEYLPKERLRPPTDEDNMAAVREMIDAYAPRYYITTSAPGRRAAEALTMGETPLLRRHRLIPNAFIYERIAP